MRTSTVLLVSTIGTVVLYVAAFTALGTPPDATADGATVAAWFAAHRGAVRVYAWLITLQVPFSITYFAIVRRELPSSHRDVFFAGGLLTVGQTAVSLWIWGALSWHTETLTPEGARLLFDVASFWGPVAIGSVLTLYAPLVLLGLGRHPVLPRWFGVLAGIMVLEQLAETATLFGQRGFIAPGGPMNLFVGGPLGLVSFVALGVVVFRRRSTPAETSSPLEPVRNP